MEHSWKKEAKGKSLEEQWNRLYNRTKPLRAEGKAIWKGGGLTSQDQLLDIFKELNIKSFIDCGCADHHWLSKLDWTGTDYTGIDIVPELIEQNKINYPDRSFINANLVKGFPHKGDMVFIRDVFTHLKLEDCLSVIENIKNSGSKYLMASSSSMEENMETSCLVLYPRNLRIEPFNLPEPIKEIEDKGKEGYYMGIWKVEEL